MPCLLYHPALTTIHDHWDDYMDLSWQNNFSAFQHTNFVIAFLPRSDCLLISWLQPPSAVILEPKKRKSATASTLSPLCHEVIGLDAMISVFLIFSFKPGFSLSSFTLIKKLFSSSSLSAIRVVSFTYPALQVESLLSELPEKPLTNIQRF